MKKESNSSAAKKVAAGVAGLAGAAAAAAAAGATLNSTDGVEMPIDDIIDPEPIDDATYDGGDLPEVEVVVTGSHSEATHYADGIMAREIEINNEPTEEVLVEEEVLPEPAEPEPESAEAETVEPEPVEPESAEPEPVEEIVAEPEPMEETVAEPEPVDDAAEPEPVEEVVAEPEPVEDVIEPEPMEDVIEDVIEPEPAPEVDDDDWGHVSVDDEDINMSEEGMLGRDLDDTTTFDVDGRDLDGGQEAGFIDHVEQIIDDFTQDMHDLF